MKLGQFVFVQQVFCNEQQSDIRLGVRNMSKENKNVKEWTEQEWKTRLNPEQYRVLRLKGTELAGSGSYNKHYKEGTYLCAGCKMPVYTSETKFDSGCGWPAFYDAVPNAIKSIPDPDGRRIEIVCANCNGHMGHVFKNEGFPTPTDERHCVNSASLIFHAGESSKS
ncbi:hypothetical protein ABG067_004189 [Albugo candida]